MDKFKEKVKEKATELFDKYYIIQDVICWDGDKLSKELEELYKRSGDGYNKYWVELARSSCMVAVNEIIEAVEKDSRTEHFWWEVLSEVVFMDYDPMVSDYMISKARNEAKDL